MNKRLMTEILSIRGGLYPILRQLLRSAYRTADARDCSRGGSKHRANVIAVIGLVLWGSFPTAHADVADAVATIKPGVVGVGTFQPLRSPRANLTGTGFVVGDGRYVASCAHIFKGLLDSERNESWAVLVGQDRQVTARLAVIVARDDERDLILLKISGDPLPALKLSASDAVREGWQLYFTGFPIGSVLGLNPSTHRAGLAAVVPIYTPVRSVSQLNVRTLKQAQAPYEVYELDAIAYPGNSGSPLWHPDTGEVLGVLNSVFVRGSKDAALSAPSGISYAIPVKYLRELLARAQVK